MKADPLAVRFSCLGSSVLGVIDLPERPLPRGVLVVAGQPHSRLGESRQFAMLARALARRGIAVMRFDRRGVGDSGGCEHNDSDVRAAVDEFGRQVPALRDIVLLSPAGPAAIGSALACASEDEQISGLILLEAWQHLAQHAGRRDGRNKLALLDAAMPGVAPIGASLYWRRATTPRRRVSAEERLAALASQLAAFPGPVLLVAAAPPRLGSAAVDDADMQAALARLSLLLERCGHAGRVEIVCAAAHCQQETPHDGDGPGRGGLTDICASWLVSW